MTISGGPRLLGIFKRRKQSPDDVLKTALGEFELPGFSGAVMRTLQLLRNPAADSRLIARSIEVNPALVVRVLRIVNSAAFGLRKRVQSVSQAVTLLGRSQLEPLVVAMAVRDRLPARPLVSSYRSDRFWMAATRRAALARALASLLHPQTQSEAFVAGLLQDMAVPLLAQVRPRSYGPILSHWHGDAASELDCLERSEFGWDHTAVGASMANRWELPGILISSIGGHHEEDSEAVPSVRLAGFIREMNGDAQLRRLVEVCRGSYALKPDVVVASVKTAFEEAEELAPLFT